MAVCLEVFFGIVESCWPDRSLQCPIEAQSSLPRSFKTALARFYSCSLTAFVVHLSFGRKGTRPDLENNGNESISTYIAMDSCDVNHLTDCRDLDDTDHGNFVF